MSVLYRGKRISEKGQENAGGPGGGGTFGAKYSGYGEMLLSSGAEVKRVEDTLSRMGAACGAEKVNIFVITASIMATMEFSGGVRVTQIRRISRSPKYDFRRLEALNRLSRECVPGAC